MVNAHASGAINDNVPIVIETVKTLNPFNIFLTIFKISISF